MAFLHAKTFETRWGLALAFIELDLRDDIEKLRLQLWAPIGENGDDGQVTMSIGLNEDASDEAHDAMSAGNRAALEKMTAAEFEAAFEKAGVGGTLDDVCKVEAA